AAGRDLAEGRRCARARVRGCAGVLRAARTLSAAARARRVGARRREACRRGGGLAFDTDAADRDRDRRVDRARGLRRPPLHERPRLQSGFEVSVRAVSRAEHLARLAARSDPAGAAVISPAPDVYDSRWKWVRSAKPLSELHIFTSTTSICLPAGGAARKILDMTRTFVKHTRWCSRNLRTARKSNAAGS